MRRLTFHQKENNIFFFKDNLNFEKYLINVSKFYYSKIIKYRTGNHRGLGAKSQNLSSVAPPGRKSWLLFYGRDMTGGLRNPCFTKFFVVNYL